MQSHAPEAVDLSKGAEVRRKLYGLDQKHTEISDRAVCWPGVWWSAASASCSSIHGGGPVSMQWDAHKDLRENHEKMCGLTDQPIAALLTDLKQRGLLDSTLVDLGHRVRTSADVAVRQRSRSQSARFHDVVRRRRRQSRAGVGKRTNSVLRASGTDIPMRDFHATSCTCWGSIRTSCGICTTGGHEKLTDFGGNVIKGVTG